MPSITYRITVTEAYLEKDTANWLAHDPKLRFVSLMLNDKVVWGSVHRNYWSRTVPDAICRTEFCCDSDVFPRIAGFVRGYTPDRRTSITGSTEECGALGFHEREDGVSTASQHSNANFQWAAFTRAVAYPEGLVDMREVAGVWLPDQSLIEGTPQGARDMASKKVSEYSVAS